MIRRLLAGSLGALLLAALGIASAQNAYTSRPMNVRAGPNRDYPLVAQLGPGAPLEVHGCLSDWSWCDVSFDDARGWIYSGGLSFVYRGETVPFYSYAPSFGLPILTFSLLPYWNHHYRGRPWFSHRDEWAHRRLPPHRRPPGRPHRRPPPLPYGRPPHGVRPGAGPVQPPRAAPGQMRGRAVFPRETPPHRPPPRGRPPRARPNADHHHPPPDRAPHEHGQGVAPAG